MRRTIFTLTMIAALAMTHLQSLNAFSGGSGNSVDDPYLISNVVDLEEVRSVADQNLFFKMTADITLTTDWTPIGEWGSDGASGAFQGHFDGDGHTISGLQIYRNNGDAGLFGWVKNSTIKNLTVYTNETGINTAGDFNGILAGTIGDWDNPGNSTIENCTVSGNVRGSAANGGLLGRSTISTIINCHAIDVYVESRYWNTAALIGTLAGESSTVENCTVSNAIVKTVENNAIGGIVGTAESSSASIITGCTVTGIEFIGRGGGEGAGGIIGFSNRANISDCVVTDVTLTSEDFGAQGGLVGLIQNDNTKIVNCHVSRVVGYNLGGDCGGLIGKTKSYALVDGCSVTGVDLSGRGTVGGFIGKRENGTSGTITNCQAYATIKGEPISEGSWAETLGGFVGFNEGGGAIRNCLFVGNIIQGQLRDYFTSTKVGGFVGWSTANADTYAFENCAAIAKVDVEWPLYGWDESGVGGFVGLLSSNIPSSGLISNCFFSGTVQGAGKVGGFVGTLKASGSAISNCYAHAEIIAASNEKIGGFVGQRWNIGAPITNSYFIGSINQTGGEVGAFCGVNDGDAINGYAQTITDIDPVGLGSHAVVSVAKADLKTLSAYTGISSYDCQDGQTYPYFADQSAPAVVSTANPNKVAGLLFNAAEKVEVLFDYMPLAAISPAPTSWQIELPGLAIGDAINLLAFESDKMVSYPISAFIEEDTGMGTLNTENGPAVSVRYFNLQGIEIAQPEINNIYIVKSVLQSGKTKADKILLTK